MEINFLSNVWDKEDRFLTVYSSVGNLKHNATSRTDIADYHQLR